MDTSTLAVARMEIDRTGAKVIFETIGGSRLYGTHRPDSDTDVRGVALEPVGTLIGLESSWEQYERHDPDVVVYGLRKFIRLAAANNPNILDMLFAPESAWLRKTQSWIGIYELRHDLLYQGIRKTYVGYAVSQLKRIETYHRWAGGSPPPLGTRDLASYDEYIRTRNPARYELEQRAGYDTKHGAHLMRLLLQGRDILRDGDFSPVLGGTNRDMVLSVLNGEMPYERLIAWSERAMETIDGMDSALPKAPRLGRVRDAVIDMTRAHVR